MEQHDQQETVYEAPAVEDISTAEGPATVAAGSTTQTSPPPPPA